MIFQSLIFQETIPQLLATLLAITSPFGGAQPIDSDSHSFSEWNCAQEVWLQGPELKNGVFHGTLRSDCSLAESCQVDFAVLRQEFMGMALAADAVHAGPVEVSFRDLAGIAFDVSTYDKSDKFEVTIRKDMLIATNFSDRFEFGQYSKNIKGTGDAQFLRRLDFAFGLRDQRDPGAESCTLRVEKTFHIAKPWYAPGGIFKSEVEKALREELKKDRAQLFQRVRSFTR